MVKTNKKEVEEGKIVAVLSYFLVGIIWFFVDEQMRKNEFVKFHVKQGIALIILGITLSIVTAVLFGTIGFMLSFMVIGVLSQLVNLGLFILGIMGVISAANGTVKKLPIVELITEKLNF